MSLETLDRVINDGDEWIEVVLPGIGCESIEPMLDAEALIRHHLDPALHFNKRAEYLAQSIAWCIHLDRLTGEKAAEIIADKLDPSRQLELKYS